MNRFARLIAMLAALLLAIVAVAQADDGTSGSSTDGSKTTRTVSVPTVAVTKPASGGVTLVPKKPDDGDTSDVADPTGVEHQPNDAGQAAPAEDPVLGETLAVTPTEGTVKVRQPDGTWSAMTAGVALPNDTVVDARKGAITLAATVDAAGEQQSATFSGAVFAFHQPNAAHSVTQLKLQGGDFSVCKSATPAVAHGARAVAAARSKPVRKLFGSGHGRFRTEGRLAAATVHGTIWVTSDYCDRTVVTVKRGVVGVTDLKTGRVVNVHAGSSRTIRRR